MPTRKKQRRAPSDTSIRPLNDYGDRVEIESDAEVADIILSAADALIYGDTKHGAGSWAQVDEAKYLSALMRHVGAHQKGEILDPESGIPHLGHAIANIIIMWRRCARARKE